MERSQQMATRLRSEAPRPPGLTGAQRRDDGVNSAGPNASGKTRETVISNELTIEGTVRSEGVVRLEGMLLGDIDCASFTLEPTGEMHGKIFAEEVSLRGKHSGPVKGGKVMLTSSAGRTRFCSRVIRCPPNASGKTSLTPMRQCAIVFVRLS